jgi:hypothetical protein
MLTHFNQDLNKSCIAEKFVVLSLNKKKERRKLSQYKDLKDQARKIRPDRTETSFQNLSK